MYAFDPSLKHIGDYILIDESKIDKNIKLFGKTFRIALADGVNRSVSDIIRRNRLVYIANYLLCEIVDINKTDFNVTFVVKPVREKELKSSPVPLTSINKVLLNTSFFYTIEERNTDIEPPDIVVKLFAFPSEVFYELSILSMEVHLLNMKEPESLNDTIDILVKFPDDNIVKFSTSVGTICDMLFGRGDVIGCVSPSGVDVTARRAFISDYTKVFVNRVLQIANKIIDQTAEKVLKEIDTNNTTPTFIITKVLKQTGADNAHDNFKLYIATRTLFKMVRHGLLKDYRVHKLYKELESLVGTCQSTGSECSNALYRLMKEFERSLIIMATNVLKDIKIESSPGSYFRKTGKSVATGNFS